MHAETQVFFAELLQPRLLASPQTSKAPHFLEYFAFFRLTTKLLRARLLPLEHPQKALQLSYQLQFSLD
jgi:hypothetical protein